MATPAKHALLSASAAHRWLKCTAAPTYEMQFPPKTSEYAEEGTLAHSICELYARKKFTVMSTRKFNSELKKLQEHPLYKPEMLTTAESYVLYLYGVCMRYEGMPHVNMEVRVDLSDYVPQGFGTCDCIIIGGDTLHITDYKHGQGVVVEAEGNPQMMLYALGALKRYTPVFGDKIKQVSMAIVQPRVTQDVKECEMTVDELLAWGENVVKPAAQKAFNGEGEFCAGAHCKFCRGRDVCPARAKLNTALEDFKDCITPDKAQNPLDPAARKVLGLPPVLTDAEVGDLLTRGANLVEWYEGLRNYALQAILDGKEIPGYKVVEGRSVRAFRDTDAALQKLMDSGFDKAVIYDYEPKTLAQLEKIVGAKRFAELLGDQIVKPKGKATLTDEKDPRARIAPPSWTLPGWCRMADVRDGPLYRKENLVLNVGGETVHIDCPERFAWLLDDKLGGDAADYFRDTVTNLCFDLDLCPGECDRTYGLQEHYQNVIRDALDVLADAQERELCRPWTSGRVSIKRYNEAVRMLQNELKIEKVRILSCIRMMLRKS